MKEDEMTSFDDGKSVRILCSSDDVMSHILAEVQDIKTCFTTRLTSLEMKVTHLAQTCNKMFVTLDSLDKSREYSKVNDGLIYESTMKPCIVQKDDKLSCTSSKLKLVPLTNETDYPNGSWLGDPKVPACRVRCHIPPAKLFHIDNTCLTPIKMALTLLDNLFTKDELAFSNISGKSRKGKKQLSPILIFAIKCHLQYKFGIPEKEWIKIGQNIDAKCRFAYKKRTEICEKQHMKGEKRKNMILPTSSTEDISFDFEPLHHGNIDFNNCVKVISETPCELRIVNATPAQLAHLQESQEIILAEEMMPDSNVRKRILINSPEVSMNTVVMSSDDDCLDLTIPTSDVHIKVESMKVSRSKKRSSHHLHEISLKEDNSEELTLHEEPLDDRLHLEVELDSRSEG